MRCGLKFLAPAPNMAPGAGGPPLYAAPTAAPTPPSEAKPKSRGSGMFGLDSQEMQAPSGLFGEEEVGVSDLFGEPSEDTSGSDEGEPVPEQAAPPPGYPAPPPHGQAPHGHPGQAPHGQAPQGQPNAYPYPYPQQGYYPPPQGYYPPPGAPTPGQAPAAGQPAGYPQYPQYPGYPPPQYPGYPPPQYPGYPPQYPGYPQGQAQGQPAPGQPAPGHPPGHQPAPSSAESAPLELAPLDLAPSGAGFTLVALQGLQDGTRFDLPGGKVYLMGRDREADIKLLSTSVSRRQARIDATGDTPVLIDLGSANGTKVNSAAVDRHPLQEGDLIKMGQVVLRFQGSA